MTQTVLDDTLRPATGPGGRCAWCRGVIPDVSRETGRKTRSDALTCSKECRQASWRFGFDGPDWHAVNVRARTFAYADPPYRGRCSWEPVLFAGGRPRSLDAPMLLDWIHAAPPRTLPGQVIGTKPSAFSVWVFNMLGAQPGDTLHDLFPGSGAVGRAWARFTGEETSTVDRDDVARDSARDACLGGHDVQGPMCPQCNTHPEEEPCPASPDR